MFNNGNKILDVLEGFRTRKLMYIDPVCAEEAEKFLGAFDIGCFACGIPLEWHDVVERRGWKLVSVSLIPQMRERGLSEEQVIDELIAFREEAVRSYGN
jgi:hypothetical protein